MGEPVTPEPAPDPAAVVAECVYRANLMEGDGSWEDLTAEEREALTDCARDHIAAHIAWLGSVGFRVLPLNAVPKPQSEAEAFAMLQAAKAWFDGNKRKAKLLGSAPKKLIVPGRAH